METTQDIPIGRTKEDIKTREKIIKDFYAKWIAEHPDKKVFNVSKSRSGTVLHYSSTGAKINKAINSCLSDGLYIWGSKRL